MHFELWQWAVALLTTLVAATLQGTIGFGYAVLSVPILSLVDPRLAPVPQIVTAIPLTLIAAGREWSEMDLKGALWILLGRIPGAAIGASLLAIASPGALDVVIGAVVLLAVGILATPVTIKRSPLVDLAVGTFSTACGYVSAIGGPPIALLFRDARGPTLRATLGFLFGVSVVITLGVRSATGQLTWLDMQLGVALSPAVLLGMWISRRFHARVEGTVLKRSVLVVSAIAALGLVARATLS